ncbi:MAG: gamma-glutamyl-gamma-aminobutyrate hydrolase family protein [Alphaproteobacteria bacterium]
MQGFPIVGIAADVKSFDDFEWHATIDTFPQAVVHGAEATPLIIPAMGADIDVDGLMSRIDGVLLPGARANVHPSEYGAAPSPKSEPHDRQRDAAALPLIRAALRHGVPLLAICRGIQELNVALGGTLIAEVQELEDRDDHRAEMHDDLDMRFAIRQDVHIKPGGVLAEILGRATIRVNSLHRQAIDRLAEELAIEATAPDGTIEAVRVRNAASFAIGVQWHPEYWVRTDPPSMLIFKAFGDAVRAHQARGHTGQQTPRSVA